jgi:hypothetical protein
LLRYILNVLTTPHDTANDGKQPRLMDAYQFLISRLVTRLSTPD